MNESERLDLLSVAQDAATQAGELIRKEWRDPKRLPNKGFRDWVTKSDLAVQHLLTRVIGSQFPGHGFFTEEADETLSASSRTDWYEINCGSYAPYCSRSRAVPHCGFSAT